MTAPIVQAVAIAVALVVPVSLTAPLGSTKGSVVAEDTPSRTRDDTGRSLMTDDGIWYPTRSPSPPQ